MRIPAIQTSTGRCGVSCLMCARERAWTWTAARAASALRSQLSQDGLAGQVSCKAVAGGDMAVSVETVQSLQLEDGKVLGHQKGVALVEGLNDSAPVGALVLFSNGAKGVGLCSVLVTEHGEDGEEGLKNATAQFLLKKDPMELTETLKDPENDSSDAAPALAALFTRLSVAAGDVCPGQVVDHLCRPVNGSQEQQERAADDSTKQVPLLNDQVAMESRGVISEPLFTGIPAVDVLTPLAHGCALLAAGADPSATTDLLMRVTAHLSHPSDSSSDSNNPEHLRVVYVAAGCSQEELDRRVERLEATGALKHCTVVAAPDTAPVAQQYAALCAGVAIGEHVRDSGGKAIVLLDSAECMVTVWKAAVALALGGAPQKDNGDMVEVNGMLVSAAAAERRRFLSALVQRAAKRLSGGTLTLLLALVGVPASGEKNASTAGRAPPPLDQYKHLSEELKAKMAKALAAKAAAERDSAPQVGSVAHLATETVEEMMSISDGQIVLKAAPTSSITTSTTTTTSSSASKNSDQSAQSEQSQSQRHQDDQTDHEDRDEEPLRLDVLASLSRMGTRAYPLALKDLAPKVRFELTQALDADRYSTTTADAVQRSCRARCRLLEAALASPHILSIGETASLVWLLLHGHLDSVPSEDLWKVWPKVWSAIEQGAPDSVAEMAATQQLTEASKAQALKFCKKVLQN